MVSIDFLSSFTFGLIKSDIQNLQSQCQQNEIRKLNLGFKVLISVLENSVHSHLDKFDLICTPQHKSEKLNILQKIIILI